MTVTVKVEGLARLDRALLDLGNKALSRRIGRKALQQALAPVAETAARLAPDDPGTSPSLKDAIREAPLRSRGDELWHGVGIDPSVQPAQERARQSGKGAYRDPGAAGVGPIQEFGTEKMVANPFMRPAWDGHKGGLIGAVAGVLGPEIAQAAARLGK